MTLRKRLETLKGEALQWAREFLEDYPDAPKECIVAYATGRMERSLQHRGTDEGLRLCLEGIALKHLAEKR